MTESFTGGSEQYRQPPTPDQYKSVHDLVTSFPPGRQTLTYEDDSGVRHNVFIINHTGMPAEDMPEDRPNAVAFVNDAAFSDKAPVLYYFDANPNATSDDDRWSLRLEEFKVSDLFDSSTPLGKVVQMGLERRDDSEVAKALDVQAANAAQAQDLINLMTAVKARGVRL